MIFPNHPCRSGESYYSLFLQPQFALQIVRLLPLTPERASFIRAGDTLSRPRKNLYSATSGCLFKVVSVENEQRVIGIGTLSIEHCMLHGVDEAEVARPQ